MTKRVLIEVIQNRLASDDVTADLKGRYPYQIVEWLIGLSWVDFLYAIPEAMQEMYQTYTITPTVVGTKYRATLDPKPAGSFAMGPVVVPATSIFYPVNQGGQESFFMQTVNPNTLACQLVNGNVLEWTFNPGETLEATYVPDFQAMDRNANVNIPGEMEKLYQIVIQTIRATDTRPQEIYNDSREDITQK